MDDKHWFIDDPEQPVIVEVRIDPAHIDNLGFDALERANFYLVTSGFACLVEDPIERAKLRKQALDWLGNYKGTLIYLTRAQLEAERGITFAA